MNPKKKKKKKKKEKESLFGEACKYELAPNEWFPPSKGQYRLFMALFNC